MYYVVSYNLSRMFKIRYIPKYMLNARNRNYVSTNFSRNNTPGPSAVTHDLCVFSIKSLIMHH